MLRDKLGVRCSSRCGGARLRRQKCCEGSGWGAAPRLLLFRASACRGSVTAASLPSPFLLTNLAVSWCRPPPPLPTRSLLTNELEAEVFLALLERHSDAVVGAQEEGSRAAAEYASAGDGGAAAAGSGPQRRGPAALLQRLLAPLRLGQEEVVPALGKLGSAAAVSHLQQRLMAKLGGRLLTSHVHYEAALHLALSAGSKGVKGGLSAKVAVQVGEGRVGRQLGWWCCLGGAGVQHGAGGK